MSIEMDATHIIEVCDKLINYSISHKKRIWDEMCEKYSYPVKTWYGKQKEATEYVIYQRALKDRKIPYEMFMNYDDIFFDNCDWLKTRATELRRNAIVAVNHDNNRYKVDEDFFWLFHCYDNLVETENGIV